MRQLSSLFQLICSFIAFVMEEYPFTFFFFMIVFLYVNSQITGIPMSSLFTCRLYDMSNCGLD